MSSYVLYLPMPIIATLLAFIYGLSIHRAWVSALLTCVLVVLGGWLYAAIGQIIGVIVSALLIFLIFTLPEQRRRAHEDWRREHEAVHLPNEEDY